MRNGTLITPYLLPIRNKMNIFIQKIKYRVPKQLFFMNFTYKTLTPSRVKTF